MNRQCSSTIVLELHALLTIYLFIFANGMNGYDTATEKLLNLVSFMILKISTERAFMPTCMSPCEASVRHVGVSPCCISLYMTIGI